MRHATVRLPRERDGVHARERQVSRIEAEAHVGRRQDPLDLVFALDQRAAGHAFGVGRRHQHHARPLRQAEFVRLRKRRRNGPHIVLGLGVRVDVERRDATRLKPPVNLLVELLRALRERYAAGVRVGRRLEERVEVDHVVRLRRLRLGDELQSVGRHDCDIPLAAHAEVLVGEFHDQRVDFHHVDPQLRIALPEESRL